MSLARKLLLKEGLSVRTFGLPEGVDLGAPSKEGGRGPFDVVILFVRKRTDVDSKAAQAMAAMRPGGLLWIAYPKGGGLGTDLHRDSLWEAMKPTGWRPVTQVAIDATWSALRFRPEGDVKPRAR